MTTSATHQKFQTIRSELNAAFVERSEMIDGSLVALLTKEHALLFGAPGAAKSALVRVLAGCFSDGRYYETLLSKFSTPEALFGPYSMKALAEDRHARATTNTAVDADFVFVDETYNANASVLTSMNALMNERVFHNGNAKIDCPLVSMFGATNVLPDDDDQSLNALHDRFMIRLETSYIKDRDNLKALLMRKLPKVSVKISMADLRTAQNEVAAMPINELAMDAMIDATSEISTKLSVEISDRRKFKAVAILQAYAWLLGDAEVTRDHIEILSSVFWTKLDNKREVAEIISRYGDPTPSRVANLLSCASDTMAEFEKAIRTTDPVARKNAGATALKEVANIRTMLLEECNTATARNKARVNDALEEIKYTHKRIAMKTAEAMGTKL